MTEASTAVRHRSTVHRPSLARLDAPRTAEERERTSNRRRSAVCGFRPRIALGWGESHGPIADAADAIDRCGRALGAVFERAERGKLPIPGEVDAALALSAGIDPSIVFLAQAFAAERHYQARYAARVPMPRINPPCRVRRCRARARRSHRVVRAVVKTAGGDSGDPDPEPPTPRHTATIGGVL